MLTTSEQHIVTMEGIIILLCYVVTALVAWHLLGWLGIIAFVAGTVGGLVV